VNAGAFASRTPLAGVWEERDIGLRVWAPEIACGDSTRVGHRQRDRKQEHRRAGIGDQVGSGSKPADSMANAEDDHTKSVFDPEIRGKTDRYVLRFRKPE
jgi:hypothetical protein